ncbi:MAG: hypothetical protein COV43_07915 [Deltaproteobacteria bacterium CG11_big_fil_rev_8_21_14_0_20_42_23]|nr:MAG: hypothetical protein COV43_07915 [Deltaproteobacteria bacterium CG11_big_fil_rev_8_21_14_0_20_42_23]PJC64139.1 MAG: hypothetical protein CO021_05690 [Deltaproteobacteria bacterium CG_4_9_14_0_2_um_filter_42_21]
MKRILITGGKGFIGSALTEFFEEKGYEIFTLSRKKEKTSDIFWDPQHKRINPSELEGFDAVIHLAGASVFGKPWTKKYKDEIKASRVEGTSFLCETLSQLQEKPKVLSPP